MIRIEVCAVKRVGGATAVGGILTCGRRKGAARKEGQKEERRGRVATGERVGRSLLRAILKVEERGGGETGGMSGTGGVEPGLGVEGRRVAGKEEVGGKEDVSPADNLWTLTNLA
ncbi:hypothetical protein E2C01_097870 [Portunus trituberculatus]|uniref:Uncharacterized protein n=1 Tax=Portunus trituberculatus TaxID=210409 RepID=A0A5B7KCH9_PORTR|nr:hypothetical protein [Portunus trituberculatus]